MKRTLSVTVALVLAFCLSSMPVLADPLVLTGRSSADLSRDLTSKPAEVLALLPLQPGQRVLDLFGGDGYHSELLAQRVGPAGKVLLHNNKAYLGFVADKLPTRLAGNRLPNVQRYDKEADQLALPAASLDAVVFMLAFHDFYFESPDWQVKADQVLPQLQQALKPGGYLLLSDHYARAGSGSSDAQQLHRIEPELVIRQMAAAGFTLISHSDVLRNPADDHSKSVFDPAVRGQTDRFVLLFQRR